MRRPCVYREAEILTRLALGVDVRRLGDAQLRRWKAIRSALRPPAAADSVGCLVRRCWSV